MRLVQAMGGARRGGAETFFERLVPALGRAGIEQHAAIRRDAGRAARLAAAGVPVTEFGFGGQLDLLTRPLFGRLIDRVRPDIVLTWMNRATRHCPRPGRRRRFVFAGTPRGYYEPDYYRDCDAVVVTTRDLADFYVRNGIRADRLQVIPNFVPEPTAAVADRAAEATPPGVPLLLALGRLHRNKGFDVLLRALAALPEHWLWIGGEGPLEAELRRLADELGVAGRVRFLGWRDDTAPLFGAADAFVCSSRIEPFGNIVVEAWAARVPLVAARVQGPAALLSDGEDGLLVPPEDAGAMAAAIRRLAGEPALADRLTDAGRPRFEAAYSEPVVVGAYREWLAGLAG